MNRVRGLHPAAAEPVQNLPDDPGIFDAEPVMPAEGMIAKSQPQGTKTRVPQKHFDVRTLHSPSSQGPRSTLF